MVITGGDYRRIVIEQGGILMLISVLDKVTLATGGARKDIHNSVKASSPPSSVTADNPHGQAILHALYALVSIIYNRRMAKYFLAGDGLQRIVQLCCSPIEFPYKMRIFILSTQVRILN